MPCSKCEMFVKLKEIGGHDCIKDMRRSIEAQALQINTLTKFVFTLASNFNTAVALTQRIDLGDLINKLSIIGVGQTSIPPLPKVYSIIFSGHKQISKYSGSTTFHCVPHDQPLLKHDSTQAIRSGACDCCRLSLSMIKRKERFECR